MQPSEVVQRHPNTSVAVGATGPATLVVWIISQWWPKMPNVVSAVLAGLVISTALFFGRYIRAAASAVNREGLLPCLRRLVFGPPPAPPPAGP